MTFGKTLVSRRRALRSAGAASSALMLAACGGNTSNNGTRNTATNGTPSSGSSTGSAKSTPGQATPAPQRGGIIHVPTPQEPPDFDGTTQYTVPIHNNMAQAYNRLLRWNWGPGVEASSTEIKSELASSWEQSDPTTVVLHLVNNAKFHDIAPVSGRTLTSEDVQATFSRIMSPDLHSQLAGKFNGYLDHIETPDPQTAVIKLSKPYAELFNALAFHYTWIIPKELSTGSALKTQMIGTGPFVLDNWKKGERISFKRNPAYWEEGKPAVDGIDRILMSDAGAIVSAFAAGQLDFIDPQATNLDPETIQSLKSKVPGSTTQEDYPWATRRLQITPTRPPLDDPRVRLAILKLVDQQQIIDVVYQKGAFVGSLPWMFGPFGLPEADAKSLLKVDVAGAKQLLSAAAFDFNQELEIAVTPQYGPQYNSTAQLIQQQLQKAGIKTKINTYQYAEYLARWKPPFDKNQLAVAPLTGNSPDLLYTAYNPKGDYYFQLVADQKLINMTEQQRTILDTNQRAQFTKDVQKYLLTENVIDVPLGLPLGTVIKRPNLQSFYYTNTFGAPSVRDAWLRS
jgi:peptide/nickel transport system substrate-binding protein